MPFPELPFHTGEWRDLALIALIGAPDVFDDGSWTRENKPRTASIPACANRHQEAACQKRELRDLLSDLDVIALGLDIGSLQKNETGLCSQEELLNAVSQPPTSPWHFVVRFEAVRRGARWLAA